MGIWFFSRSEQCGSGTRKRTDLRADRLLLVLQCGRSDADRLTLANRSPHSGRGDTGPSVRRSTVAAAAALYRWDRHVKFSDYRKSQ